MKAYEINKPGIENLALVEHDHPQAITGCVVVKIHAASLNYRDFGVIDGSYPVAKKPLIPLSDGAGEVVEVGEGVTQWKVGDRVCPTFHQYWNEGFISPGKLKGALGGGLDGVLREFAVFHENGLIRIPEYLSYEEAATLPCAALTAWHGLVISGKVKAGDSVLTLGTGGVSTFALQFALMHGAKVFSTSSSDDKLAKSKRLGAHEIINYKKTPDWDQEILHKTQNRGVDHVVEVGGARTLPKSLNSLKLGGHIALIGRLGGGGEIDPIPIFRRAARFQGIYVGSREMFTSMNRALEANQIKPVIDKVFDFDQIKDALKHMEAGAHHGKIVVRISKA
jgi:NADPH:quinone reductase-like Zn-dependent oxidoreductase